MAALPQLNTLRTSKTPFNTDDAITTAENSVLIRTTIQSSIKTLEQFPFDNNHCKLTFKFLNVIGGQNAKLTTKRNLLTSKMVQRKVSLATICKMIDLSADASSIDCAPASELPATTVRATRNSNDQEAAIWLKRDIPVFAGSVILIGEPPFGPQMQFLLCSPRVDILLQQWYFVDCCIF